MRGWSFVQDYTRKESNLKNASDNKYLKGCPCFYYDITQPCCSYK